MSSLLTDKMPLGPTDWYYRTFVPKDPADNLVWRQECLKRGYEDPEFAKELWIICARDILFWINTFGWLLEPRDKGPWQPSRVFGGAREIPFITRPYQDEYILEALGSLGVEDMLNLKSRAMGATWMFLYLFYHEWAFLPQQHFGIVSKDEDSVDDADNPDSLMWKLDFLHEKLPMWLKAARRRNVNKHTMTNLENGSTITGYACTGNMARGGRKRAFLNDEMHSWPPESDEAAQDSLAHVTHCRIMVSTPSRQRGQSGVFYDAANDFEASMKRLDLDWKMDGEKAAGMYTTEDGLPKIIDTDYVFPENYNFVLDGRVRSPYYDWECKRPGSTSQSIAAELDKDFGGATNRYVDQSVIFKARGKCRQPSIRVRLENPYADQWGRRLIVDEKGDIDVWLHADVGINREHDGEQLLLSIPHDREFSMGVDIAQGVGGASSSYSAIDIIDKRSGEQVMEWRGNRLQPKELAGFAYALGLGWNTALMVPEVTGLGNIFLANIISMCYPNLWFRPTSDDSIGAATSKRVGYDNKDGGKALLAELESGLKLGLVTVRSARVITEMERYFIDAGGRLKHPLVGKGRKNAPENSHGDCAIAFGCAWYGIHEEPEPDHLRVEEPELTTDCAAGRRKQYEDKKAVQGPSYWRDYKQPYQADYLRGR